MTISDLEHFKKILVEREHNLLEWLEMPSPATDQDVAKAQSLLGEIQEAMKRAEDKSYGSCDVCKGDIELYRLEIQPVTEVCLSCISNQERAELEEELFLASKIHRALLPQTIEKISGFEVAVRSIASRIVGGDYYDFLPTVNSTQIRVIIADTMGKGLPAGLLMSNVQGALRVLAEDINSPKELISKLNRWLCRNVPVTKFISLICLSLHANGNQQLVYTNAGHCPAILIRQNGKVEKLNPTGGVIGVHQEFEYEEKGMSILPGDLLLLYTDGIIEAQRTDGEMFGEQRMIEYITSRRNSNLYDLVDGLLGEVRSFSDRSEFEDDLTVISLRRTST